MEGQVYIYIYIHLKVNLIFWRSKQDNKKILGDKIHIYIQQKKKNIKDMPLVLKGEISRFQGFYQTIQRSSEEFKS